MRSISGISNKSRARPRREMKSVLLDETEPAEGQRCVEKTVSRANSESNTIGGLHEDSIPI